MPKKLVLTLIVLVAFMAPNFAQTTINVPAQVGNILAAINLAQNGDTILVAPGTYNIANINFGGKAITLEGAGGSAVTTIDGLGSPRIILFNSGETASSVIKGFTIRGGQTGDGSDGTMGSLDGEDGTDGGAVLIVGASPTFIDCVFRDNATGNGGDGTLGMIGSSGADGGAGGRGGAIFVDAGNPTFTDCSFINNSTGSGGDGMGSGFPDVNMNPTVADGGAGGHGGAIYINAGDVSFANCIFESNLCGNGGKGSNGNSLGADSGAGALGGSGGGIYLATGTVSITGSFFQLNTCGTGGDSGGALGSESMAGGDGGSGGAVFSSGSQIDITRTNFALNTAGNGGVGGFSGGFFGVAGTAAIGGFGGNGGALSLNGNHTIDACAFAANVAGNGGVGGDGFGVTAGVGGFGGSGGAIAVNSGSGSISNAILLSNKAGDGNDSGASDIVMAGAGNAGVGGGIIVIGGTTTLSSSTIVNNNAGLPGAIGFPGGTGLGGGVFAFAGTFNVANSIVRDNVANGGSSNIFNLGLGSFAAEFCNVGGGFAGAGNFDLDPLFLNPALNDFHLTQDSPCRDAGSIGVGVVTATDFDGDPRVFCTNIDVGADEFNSPLETIGQAPRAGLSTLDIYAIGKPGALSACGHDVTSGVNGPYRTVFDQGDTFNFDVGGQAFQPLVLMYGDLNVQSATYGAAIGQFDIGGPVDPMTGIPSALTVFQDGTGLYLPGGGYFTDASGLNSTSYVMPFFGPGVLTTFQAIMYHSGGIALSNAVQIVLNP